MRLKTIVTLLSAALTCVGLAQTTPPKFVPGQVLVKFKPSVPASTVQDVHMRIGATVLHEEATIKVQKVRVGYGMTVDQAISYYKASPHVQYVGKNLLRRITRRPNDPMLADQYGLAKIQAFAGWDLNVGKATVKIAIIDTGQDMNHPDFKGKLVDPYDAIDGDNNPTPGSTALDDSHGTHCAGIAAAATDNGIGIAGSGFNCLVMPIRVFPTAASGAPSDAIIRGMVYAANKGAKVISLSLGAPGEASPAEQDAINYAWNKGVVVMAAAGNDNVNTPFYPAWAENVVNVGASDAADQKASFSNFGDQVDVAAPGHQIQSTIVGGYMKFSGTSMACPMAAGLVGVMWSRTTRSTSPAEIVNTLIKTSDPIGPWLANGRVNMLRALKAIRVEQTTTTDATFIGVPEGTQISSPWVLASDGSYLTIGPRTISTLGLVGSASFKFKVPSVPSIQSHTFVVEGRYASGSTGQIFVYNIPAGKWEHLKSFPLGTTDTSQSVTLTVPTTDYVSGLGEIRVLVRGLLPASVATSTTDRFQIDFLQMRTAYVPDSA